MPHTGYNSDYYTTAYLVYMEDSSVSDNYIVDDWSIYFDAAPPADGQLTEVVTGETGVSTGMEGRFVRRRRPRRRRPRRRRHLSIMVTKVEIAETADTGPITADNYTDNPKETTPISSYTLIDNFDKFDLDTYDRLLGISKYTELPSPLRRTVFSEGETKEVSNYKSPFVYRWEIRPDLLRFLTNRRFFLSQDRTLVYPSQNYLWPPCGGELCTTANDMSWLYSYERYDKLSKPID